jgi:large subunit ribosomal protein L23
MNQERLMRVLLAPHVSEKATLAAEFNNQYVFQVARDATKPEVKKAVELMFDVKVTDVSIVNLPGKAKRFGRLEGRRAGKKKAYVRLAEGQTIDVFGGE